MSSSFLTGRSSEYPRCAWSIGSAKLVELGIACAMALSKDTRDGFKIDLEREAASLCSRMASPREMSGNPISIISENPVLCKEVEVLRIYDIRDDAEEILGPREVKGIIVHSLITPLEARKIASSLKEKYFLILFPGNNKEQITVYSPTRGSTTLCKDSQTGHPPKILTTENDTQSTINQGTAVLLRVAIFTNEAEEKYFGDATSTNFHFTRHLI